MSARRSRSVVWLVVLVLAVAMSARSAGGETIYVKVGGGGDGSSWENAYGDLQDALEKPPSSGDEIWVAAGTYKPGTARTDSFQMISGVAIYGGFAPTGDPAWEDRAPDTYITILSGDLAGDDGPDFTNYGENSYHVVTGDNIDETAVLDGLTITAGNADDSSNGGGMYIEQGSITLTNCTITDNYATGYMVFTGGGGIFNYAGSMTLTNCAFIGNSTSYDGGGMYNMYGESTLTNCTFIGNSAGNDGGGFSNDYENVILANCMFSGNSAGHYGGGLFNAHFGSTVSNCTFIGNTSEQVGGGVGCYRLYLNSLTLTNCTFSGNWAGEFGGAVGIGITQDDNYVKLTNCILWDNSAEEGPQVGMERYGDLYISYSCLGGGELDVYAPDATLVWDDESNIGGDLVNDNPLFVTGPSGDYYLSQVAAGQGANSPCVDTGSDTAANLGMDIYTTRSDRYSDGEIVDMGYHYSNGMVVINPDVSRDGRVDLVDFGIVSGWWLDSLCNGGNSFCGRADIDQTGGVGLDDLLILAEHWLSGVCFATPAFGPYPDDGAPDVNSRLELSWSAEECVVSYNIYFGTSSPGEFQCNQTIATFDPGALDLETMYYWRIDEVQADSSVIEGDVWRFTTRSDMLVGWWELDESEGGTAYDSAQGYDGTLNGDPTWRPGGGRIGGALEFDGVGDYVEIEGYKGVTGSNPRTVAAWVRAEPNESNLSIVYWGMMGNGAMWYNWIDANGKLRAAVFNGNIVGDTVIDDDTWHHVAIVLPDKENVKVEDILLYVDGEQEDTTINLGSQTIDTAVGMDVLISYDDSGSYGLLDDVRIYNYALSEEEIGTLAGVL